MTENRLISNMYVDDDALTVRLQLKQERQQEIEDRLKARKDAAEETRRDGAVQIVDEAIDSMIIDKNHLDGLFQIFLDGRNNAALWQPKLTLGALKPFITAWVALGIQALKTPGMKLSIKNAFANDGLFTAIRDPIKLLEIQVMEEEEIFIPAEAEKSDHYEELLLADLSSSDIGSDSDSDQFALLVI